MRKAKETVDENKEKKSKNTVSTFTFVGMLLSSIYFFFSFIFVRLPIFLFYLIFQKGTREFRCLHSYYELHSIWKTFGFRYRVQILLPLFSLVVNDYRGSTVN